MFNPVISCIWGERYEDEPFLGRAEYTTSRRGPANPPLKANVKC
jgi:hypothetical protein